MYYLALFTIIFYPPKNFFSSLNFPHPTLFFLTSPSTFHFWATLKTVGVNTQNTPGFGTPENKYKASSDLFTSIAKNSLPYLLVLEKVSWSFEWSAPHRSSLLRCMRIFQCALSDACCFAASRPMLSTPIKETASSRAQESQFLRGLPLDLLPCIGIQSRR